MNKSDPLPALHAAGREPASDDRVSGAERNRKNRVDGTRTATQESAAIIGTTPLTSRLAASAATSLPTIEAYLAPGEFAGKMSLIPALAPSTPATLYRKPFQHKKDGWTRDKAEPPRKRQSPNRQSFFGASEPHRTWQRMEMRLPQCYSFAEHELVTSVLDLLIGSPLPRSNDLSRPIVDIVLTEKPSSRQQSQLLAAWFGNQVSRLADRGKIQPELAPGVTAASMDLPTSGSLRSLGIEQAEMLMSLWDIEGLVSQPFMFMEALRQIRVEGVKVPNDRRFLQAMLQVCGTAAAAVTHQVAMHCHERGRLLVSIWNLLLGLLEFEIDQLKKQVHFLNANQDRTEGAAPQDLRAAKYRIKGLEDNAKEAKLTIAVLRRDNAEMRAANEKLVQANEILTSTQQEKIDDLQWELQNTQQKVETTEMQLDAAFTCVHVATAKGNECKEELHRIQQKLWGDEYGDVQSDETKEAISDDLSGLEEQINQVADMDKFLERHLRSIRTQSDAKSNKLGQVLHRFEASRASSMAVLQSVQSSDWRSGGNAASAGGEPENATLGGAEGNDAAEQAGTAPGGEDPKPKGESTEKVKEMLTALAAEAVAMSGNEPLLEADMTGVDEMKRDEMWEEIRSRREREIQLMALVAKMEQMHNEGGRHIAKGSSSAEDVGKSRGDSTSDNKAEEGGRGPDKRAPAWEEAGFKSQKTFLTRLTKALLGHPGIKSSNEAANEEERKAKKTSFRLPQEEEASATERLHADSSESWRMATKYNSPSKKNPGGIEAEGGAATDGAYAFPSQQEVFGDAFKALNVPPDTNEYNLAGADGSMKLDRSTKKFSHGQEGARQCAEQAPDEGAGRRETEGDRSHKKPENGKGRLKSETAHIESIAAGVREVASKVKANKMRALHNRRVSLKRIAKSIGKVAAVTAAPMPTFYCKDQTLRDAMYKNADTQPKSPDWALKVVDAVYKRLSAQDPSPAKEIYEATTVPSALMAHFASQYGARKIVQEYAAGMVATLRRYSGTHLQLSIFFKFLTEEWDNVVLAHFLKALSLCSTTGSVAVPCVEYPDPRGRMPRYVCTRKAIAISSIVLGPRAPDCVSAYIQQIKMRSVSPSGDEASQYFWSPNQGDTLEAEEQRGGPTAKIMMYDLLILLCKKAEWLERNLADTLPQMFKEHDKDLDGMISRQEVLNMLDMCFNELPDSAFLIDHLHAAKQQAWETMHTMQGIEEQQEGADGFVCYRQVGVKAFMHGAMRCDLFRKFVRLRRTGPMPVEADIVTVKNRNNNLYLVIQRSWNDAPDQFVRNRLAIGGFWDRIKSENLGTNSSSILGLVTKVESEVNGDKRAQYYLQFLRSLFEHRVDEAAALAKPTSADPARLEPALGAILQSLKVLYGYQALLEDDPETFAPMVDPSSTIAARSQAASHWSKQARFLSRYRHQVEHHAAQIICNNFAARILKRFQLRKKTALSAVAEGADKPQDRKPTLLHSPSIVNASRLVMHHDKSAAGHRARFPLV